MPGDPSETPKVSGSEPPKWKGFLSTSTITQGVVLKSPPRLLASFKVAEVEVLTRFDGPLLDTVVCLFV